MRERKKKKQTKEIKVEVTKSELLSYVDELIKQYKHSERKAGDITAVEFAKRVGLSIGGAKKILNREESQGRMERYKIKTQYGSCYAYYPIKPK